MTQKNTMILSLVLTVLMSHLPSPGLASPSLSIEGTRFVDPLGAQVILRGYAIQAKMPPFRPLSGPEDLDPIVDFGANVIRLHFNWEAAELVKGVYDESYFSYYRQVVEWAADRNLFVIIDLHNNAFSRWAAAGCGCGFPPWAITPAVALVEPKANGDCNFFEAMNDAIFLNEDNFKIWRDFLTDAYGARTRFLLLLERLATEYKGHPAIIGFDINEPLPYDTSTQTFDYEMMAQFYEAMGPVIHSIDPTMFIFIEPFAIDHVLFNRTTPYRNVNIANAVYAPHLYEVGSLIYGFPILSHSPNLISIIDSREKLNVPVMVGEWGAQMNGLQAIQDQLHLINRDFDVHLLSAIRWNYSPNWTPEEKDHFHDEDYSCFDDQHKVRAGCAPRAYVKRIAGDMKSIKLLHRGEAVIFSPQYPGLSNYFRATETVIDFEWYHDPAKGNTVLFLPVGLLFDVTPVIKTEGTVFCAFDAAQKHVSCSSDKAGLMRVVIHQ